MAALNLTDLPPELRLHILGYLNRSSVLAWRATHRGAFEGGTTKDFINMLQRVTGAAAFPSWMREIDTYAIGHALAAHGGDRHAHVAWLFHTEHHVHD